MKNRRSLGKLMVKGIFRSSETQYRSNKEGIKRWGSLKSTYVDLMFTFYQIEKIVIVELRIF